MGLEAIHPGSAANPVAMRGLQVCAGILPPQARARTCTPNSAKARLVHSPVHIPEQERLSRGTGPWSRTLPSPRHGRRGQFVTYPHCEINCGGGGSAHVETCRGAWWAVDAHQHRQLAVTPRRETVRVGDRCRLNPVTRRRRPRPLHRTALPLTLLPAPMRRLQLFDLVEHRALTRVDARLASLAQTGLATLEKLPLPGRDRLLRRLATPSGLGHRDLPADDCENKPILVFNRENRRTCHGPLPSRGARH